MSDLSTCDDNGFTVNGDSNTGVIERRPHGSSTTSDNALKKVARDDDNDDSYDTREDSVSSQHHEADGCCCCSECWRNVSGTCGVYAATGKEFISEVGDLVSSLELRRRTRELFTLQTIKDRLPVLKWLPKYRLADLQGDVVAGLTVGLTVIPQSIAYAKVAGLPPQYGLYTSFVGCFIYVLFGTSKDITIGPTAVMSLLIGSLVVSPVPLDVTYVVLVSLIGGCMQLFLGIFKIGFIIDYISHPVICGFTTASAITIIEGQLKKWFGISEKLPRDFINELIGTLKNIPNSRLYDFLLGAVCLILLHLLKNVKDIKLKNSKKSRLKGALQYTIWLIGTGRNAIVVLLAGAAAAISVSYGVRLFSASNEMPPGLPPFRAPQFTLYNPQTNYTYSTSEIFTCAFIYTLRKPDQSSNYVDWLANNGCHIRKVFIGQGSLSIGSAIIIIPLVSILEAVAIGKAFARRNGYQLDPNQELIALGLTNVMGSFLSAYTGTGSFSRTAVNSQSGVRTPSGGIVTGVLVILSLLFLTPYFNYIPDAALAAVIIASVFDLINLSIAAKMWRVCKFDLIAWILTVAFGLGLSVEYGILAGLCWSFLALLIPWNRPNVKGAEVRIIVMSISHGTYFPGTERMKDEILSKGGTDNCVVLDFTRVSFVDFSAVEGLDNLMTSFASAGSMLVFANMRPKVIEMFEKGRLKQFHHTSSVEEAIYQIRAFREERLGLRNYETDFSNDVIEKF